MSIVRPLRSTAEMSTNRPVIMSGRAKVQMEDFFIFSIDILQTIISISVNSTYLLFSYSFFF
jgi:hypothetical protein